MKVVQRLDARVILMATRLRILAEGLGMIYRLRAVSKDLSFYKR
jgi:hypothetical protein